MPHCPDFLVIGAAKSGTTSLHAYLRQHPELFLPESKEPHFFCAPGDGTPVGFVGVGSEWERLFVADPDAYAELFAGAGTRRTGECSNSYLVDPDAAPRIVAVNPDVRLIVMMRDPLERAISNWRMWRRWGGEDLELIDAIAEERLRMEQGWCFPSLYLLPGLYLEHLERWEQHVDRSQLCLVLTDELQSNRVATLQRIFTHIGVDANFEPSVDFELNRRDSHVRKSAAERLGLRLRYSPPGRAAAALLPAALRRAGRDRIRPVEFRSDFGEVPDEVRVELRARFRASTLELQRRYGLDLSNWLADPDTSGSRR
jgi:hypothetical protein